MCYNEFNPINYEETKAKLEENLKYCNFRLLVNQFLLELREKYGNMEAFRAIRFYFNDFFNNTKETKYEFKINCEMINKENFSIMRPGYIKDNEIHNFIPGSFCKIR